MGSSLNGGMKGVSEPMRRCESEAPGVVKPIRRSGEGFDLVRSLLNHRGLVATRTNRRRWAYAGPSVSQRPQRLIL